MKYLKIGENLNTLCKTFSYVQFVKTFVGLFSYLYFVNFITEDQYNHYVPELTLLYFGNALTSLLIFNFLCESKRKFVPYIFAFFEVCMACYFLYRANFYFNTLYFWGFSIISSNYFFTDIKFTSFLSLFFVAFTSFNLNLSSASVVSVEYVPSFLLSLAIFGVYNFLIYLLIEQHRQSYMKEIEKMNKNNCSLIDSIPGFVSWVDKDLKYIGVNKHMCQFFKKSEDFFLGTSIGEHTGQDQSRLKQMVSSFFNSNYEEYSDKLTYVFEGKTFHNILSMVRYGDGVLIVTFDVTKLIEVEDLIDIERERAQTCARLASFGEVSAGIAHEINNPLAVISAINYKLKRLKTKKELTDDFLDEFNQKVDKQISLITKIVKSIKTLSRDGHSDPFENKNLSELVDEVKILVEPKCKGKNIDITFPDNIENFELHCQSVQIGQVFIILLNNSVDAIKELDNKWINLSISDHNHGYEFVVEDSGPGIPKDVADNIFMPFFTTKGVGEGTGLGLSLAVKIIKLHGGEIRIDHTAKNTKFIIYLPKEQMKLAS